MWLTVEQAEREHDSIPEQALLALDAMEQANQRVMLGLNGMVRPVFFKLVVIFFALRSLFYFSFFCRVQGHGANGLAVTHRA